MSRSKDIVADQVEGAAEKPVGSFISRWSRRKHETKHPIDESAEVENEATELNLQDEESRAPVKMLCDEDMPDIETLTDNSDYTDFLSPGVSEALRKLALRKLFHSEVFNIRDGLDEYDGDYTHFEKLGSIVTSDMKHQLEMEARREAEREAEKALSQQEQIPDDEVINVIDTDTDTGDDVEEDIDNYDSDNKEKISAADLEDEEQSNQSPVINTTESDIAQRVLSSKLLVNVDNEHNIKQSAADSVPVSLSDSHNEIDAKTNNKTTPKTSLDYDK